MAAIERLDLPVNIPVTGKVKFRVDRDDPGKEFPSSSGDGTFRTWGVVVTVMSNHPDGPSPGAVGRLSLYKEDWQRFLDINPRMGGTYVFTMREQKNPETGKKYKALDVKPDGAEEAPPNREDRRPEPARSGPAPARHESRGNAMDAVMLLAGAFKQLVKNGVPEAYAG